MSIKSSGTRRWILLNPGPVNVTERVRQALLRPDVCHREKEFFTVLRSVRGKLLKIFGVQKTHTVAVLTGSGTLAVESMLSSYGDKHRKILLISNGVYGERMREILKSRGIPFRFLSSPFGRFPGLQAVESALKKDRKIKAVAMVHHETSTGILNPSRKVGRLAKKYGKTFLVDAVSSLGAEEIDFEKDGVDFCAGSAGKCLHSLPGLSFVLISKKYAKTLGTNRKNSVYLDLATTLAAQESDNTPFTPAVQLFYAFEEALRELESEGLANRIRSYAQKSHTLEEGFSRLGVRFLVEKKFRSHVLTAFWLPKGVSYKRLHDALKKKGFVIYSGQSALKDRVFRIAHLGEVSVSDLKKLVAETGKILPRRSQKNLPVPVVLAAGVGKRFGSATKTMPKCLIPIGKNGETLLSRYLDIFRELGLKKVVIVVGHLKEKIMAECRKKGAGLKIRFITNKDYRKGSIVSLYKASPALNQNALIMDADVYLPTQALARLIDSDQKSAFLFDPRVKSTGEEMMLMSKNGRLWSIAKKPDPKLKLAGEATGIVKLGPKDARLLKDILRHFVTRKIDSVEYEEAYSVLLKQRKIGFESIGNTFWSEMDFPEDLSRITQNAISL